LLAGYLYGGNPIPDKTFEPAIPDANTHLFSIGASVKQKKFKVDLAYAFQKLQNRDKNNNITDPVAGIVGDPNLIAASSANGTYKSNLHMVALSLTYMF
jgi:long-chain fatty acid transport protein